MVDDPARMLTAQTARYGPTFWYPFGGIRSVLVTSEPAVLRHVLKDHSENYRKSAIQGERMKHFLGKGLLNLHGDEWLRQRRVIQRGFRPSALAALSPLMQTALDDGLTRFEAQAAAGPVELASAMTSLTFGMVARSLFQARMTDAEVQGISQAITAVQGFMVSQTLRPYLTPWYALSGTTRRYEAMRDAGFAVLAREVARRRHEPVDDLLQTLVDTVYDDGTSMTEQEILQEAMQLLVAGHETSSNALAWALYLLLRHPEHLARARAEFEAVLGDAPVRSEDVSQLPCATAVLSEALRLYPPFWMVDRTAIEDDVADGVAIPAGSDVAAFLYGTHHDPDLWDDPEAFRPERFEADGGRAHRELLYLPFGAGPRGCVGGAFAMVQMLMVLGAVLRRYDLALADDAPVVPKAMFILRPAGGIWAHVVRRP